ncbi:hypothetical protein LEP1GSC059_0853 [Leptospira noguchii serovar Panama str. CZ214]|uniref:Uncharacterized protein n=1 Tax=Leptospira noguchii serovar Panama str. CZ214 TaxID=1001595 RepID=T0FFG9_9LEPT|nr:hypothetical protein LEP1GSC059_0853 [Leptospira noguchii serovar Panama str. CZ214]
MKIILSIRFNRKAEEINFLIILIVYLFIIIFQRRIYKVETYNLTFMVFVG